MFYEYFQVIPHMNNNDSYNYSWSIANLHAD